MPPVGIPPVGGPPVVDPPVGPPAPVRAPSVELTDRDRSLLAFTAEHRFVLPAHVGALLGVSAETASRRLRALAHAGYLHADHTLHRRPTAYQITAAGGRAVGSDLRPPRGLDADTYDHDAGLVWLALLAGAGRFGPLRAGVGERRMRSQDARAGSRSAPLGVRLGGTGPGGRPRLHYPDLLLITASGHRVALELELTSKDRARRERILAGYAADRRVGAVVYLVDRAAVGRALRRSAARLGVDDLVSVQRVDWTGPRPSAGARAVSRGAPAPRAERER